MYWCSSQCPSAPPPSTLITLTTRPHSSLLQHALTHPSYNTPSRITLTTRPHSSLLLHTLTHHSYYTPSFITASHPCSLHHSSRPPCPHSMGPTTHPLTNRDRTEAYPVSVPWDLVPVSGGPQIPYSPHPGVSCPCHENLKSLTHRTLGSRARVMRTSNPLLTAPWGLVPVS